MVLGSKYCLRSLCSSTDPAETGGLFRIAVKLMMARSESTVYVLTPICELH